MILETDFSPRTKLALLVQCLTAPLASEPQSNSVYVGGDDIFAQAVSQILDGCGYESKVSEQNGAYFVRFADPRTDGQ